MNESWKDTLKLAAVGAGALLAARAVYRRMSEYDLAGKAVLITGGSRGLGLVLARGFADEGASVAICARDPHELERACADLAARGAKVLAVPCDVTDRSQVREMVEVVTRQFGRVDVLVNNAGVIQVGPLESMTLEDFEQAMAVHFWGPLYATLAVLPQMRTRREGRIINVSSIGGRVSVPHLVPYCASKFALAGLSDGMRAELARDGVVVTSVFPGLMRTGSPRNATFKGQHRAEYAWFAISDSLPVSSIKAERAASQIITACKRGQAELVISTQALAAAKFRALFPEATADILATVNRLLPGPGGIGRARAKGRESESALAPSILTTLSEWAARRNNEVVES
jgi:NAD(P)-dependent dehydrogenase (short-subunit alcohol dehydrogenase family)